MLPDHHDHDGDPAVCDNADDGYIDLGEWPGTGTASTVSRRTETSAFWQLVARYAAEDPSAAA